MSTQFDIFDEIQLEPYEVKAAQLNNKEADIFDQIEVDESWGKSAVRWLAQIPVGIAKGLTYPLEMIKTFGYADVTDPLELERLKDIAARENVPFDENAYYEAAAAAANYFPAVSNIARITEEQTGVPLTAKTPGQKLLQYGSEVATLSPGSLLQKTTSGTASAGVAAGLESVGVPEPIAKSVAPFAGIPIGKQVGAVSVEKATSPSGLPLRQFEKVTKPTKVTGARAAKIDQKLEADFKKISDKLIETSPTGKISEQIKVNPKFKNEVIENFNNVEELSKELGGKFSSSKFKSELLKNIDKSKGEGFFPSEYGRIYSKEMKKIYKNIPPEMTPFEMVKTYRQINKELKGAYEPGKSQNFNIAKKDALLDTNKALAQDIERTFPETEFSKLFQQTNKEWSQIKDAEYMDEFINQMFEGKVDFKQGQKFYNKRTQEIFKRALGENYKDFEQLMSDFLPKQKARSLIKAAENKGFKDFSKYGLMFLIHPKAASGVFAAKELKTLYQMLLDKPQLAVTWDKGIKAMNRGDFKNAAAFFNELDQER